MWLRNCFHISAVMRDITVYNILQINLLWRLRNVMNCRFKLILTCLVLMWCFQFLSLSPMTEHVLTFYWFLTLQYLLPAAVILHQSWRIECCKKWRSGSSHRQKGWFSAFLFCSTVQSCLNTNTWFHSFQVVHMDVRGNKVKLDDDTEISYDKCLIATGELLHVSIQSLVLKEQKLTLACLQGACHEIYKLWKEQERRWWRGQLYSARSVCPQQGASEPRLYKSVTLLFFTFIWQQIPKWDEVHQFGLLCSYCERVRACR